MPSFLAVAFFLSNCVGIVLCSILSFLWYRLGLSRSLFLDKVDEHKKGGNPFSFVSADAAYFSHEYQATLPKVTVIMPCKGFSEQSAANWKSQVLTLYGGEVEFIFVVESEKDPAYNALIDLFGLTRQEGSSCATSLIEQPPSLSKVSKRGAVDEDARQMARNRKISVYAAGISWHNSQKLHNILEGISRMSADSQFLLMLDADVMLHPGTIGNLVRGLLEDPQAMVATGYPFELSVRGMGFVNYLFIVYRMLNLTTFAAEHVNYVWGGCMMLRAAEVRANMYGFLDKWREGGYSDDMILGDVVLENKRTVYCPYGSIFPCLLNKKMTFKQYWNFYTRQIFVCDTYHNEASRIKNLILIIGSFISPIGFVVPWVLQSMQWTLLVFAPLLRIFGVHMQWIRWPIVATLFGALVTQILVFVAMEFVNAELTLMCRVLSPSSHFDIKVDWFKMLQAYYLHGFITPIAGIAGYFTSHITWSGTTYFKHGGKVSQISRLDEQGAPYTALSAPTSLRRTTDSYRERGFLHPPTFEMLPETYLMTGEYLKRKRAVDSMHKRGPSVSPRLSPQLSPALPPGTPPSPISSPASLTPAAGAAAHDARAPIPSS